VSGATEAGTNNKERVFVTTRWSLVISAGRPEGDEEKARAALADLCATLAASAE